MIYLNFINNYNFDMKNIDIKSLSSIYREGEDNDG